MGAYTPTLKKLVSEIIENVLEIEGHLLCCPLPTDKICGLVNSVAFHPQCVKELVEYIIRKDEKCSRTLDSCSIWRGYWSDCRDTRPSLYEEFTEYQQLYWDKYNRELLMQLLS